MATFNYALVPAPDTHLMRIKWLGLAANADVGQALGVDFSAYQDRSVQVVGTFGTGGAITMQGSNDGGTTWSILTDPLGNNLVFSAAGMKQITELPEQIRPAVTAGTGTSALDIHLFMRGRNK